MKQILFLLLCLAFLQVPTSCMGKTNGQNIENTSAYFNVSNAEEEVTPNEQRTEKTFWDFIQKDVLSKAKPTSGNVVYYSEFSNANKAYNQILNFISPASERVIFDKKKSYKSDILALDYTETDVKGGFARLTLKFKNRKPEEYTVIFKLK